MNQTPYCLIYTLGETEAGRLRRPPFAKELRKCRVEVCLPPVCALNKGWRPQKSGSRNVPKCCFLHMVTALRVEEDHKALDLVAHWYFTDAVTLKLKGSASEFTD